MSVQATLDSIARRLLREELQALLPAPRLSDDPDGEHRAAPYRTAWVISNPASRRPSPDDPKGDR